eukprot:CAMPEP_0197265704 /NCGR_PEP_ID=MMETSP1432-20130617/2558_1 /TAXON_ID=44447 /ORGANISM="Pseudo-nitzschia delicatissima, Strain UNC1205" /LENGTH=223 /DNA_ID=CAMNT_0042730475 /DNA_START=44 /DNA_END=715 /DNA_ORIENTATION=+
MKFSAAFLAISVSSTSAFTANLNKRGSTQLTMAKLVAPSADVSALIDEATKLSQDFGPTSPEARLAWEAVEEVNAADNSAASMGSLDTECEVENITDECLEYGLALDELQELIAANGMPDNKAFEKEIATTVNPVKLTPPETGKAPNPPQLQAALVEARKLTSELGLASPEATIAWETVEEIAAAGNSNVLGGSISADECFVEAAKEACEALEELHKIVGNQE